MFAGVYVKPVEFFFIYGFLEYYISIVKSIFSDVDLGTPYLYDAAFQRKYLMTKRIKLFSKKDSIKDITYSLKKTFGFTKLIIGPESNVALT